MFSLFFDICSNNLDCISFISKRCHWHLFYFLNFSNFLTFLNKNKHAVNRNMKHAIEKYSTKNRNLIEVKDWLRALGVPIRPKTFCIFFVQKTFGKAKVKSEQIISKLESHQTIIWLFKYCTDLKLTHLFSSNVLTAGIYPKHGIFDNTTFMIKNCRD